jgi:hypothetical protein
MANETRKKFADVKFLGSEPKISDPILRSDDSRLAVAFNWYNYFYTIDEVRPWLLDFMKQNGYSKEEIALYNRSSNHKTSMSSCIVARLIQNGTKVNDEIVQRMHIKIRAIIDEMREIKEEKVSEAPRVVVSIQDRIREKTNSIIADIDCEVDRFVNNGYKKTDFNPYDFLKAKDAKSKTVMDPYVALLDELQSAIDKDDKQIVEAYEKLKKKQLTEYRDFVKMIITDCERYFGNKASSKVRKPRKKKQISAVQIVKALKYKKEDPSLKVMSIDPINIVGATSVWIYNSKYKKLTVLHTNSPIGLSVKGTTIVNVDEKISQCKTLRKPDEIIQKVLTGGKVILKNLMSQIKTKDSPAIGRINADTLLLRYIK